MNSNEEEKVELYLAKQLENILMIYFPLIALLISTKSIIASCFFPTGYGYAFTTSFNIIVIGAVAINLKNFVYDNVFFMKNKNFYQIPSLVFGGGVSYLVSQKFIYLDLYTYASLIFITGSVTALLASVILSSLLIKIRFPIKSLFLFSVTSLGLWFVIDCLNSSVRSIAIPNFISLLVYSILTIATVFINFHVVSKYSIAEAIPPESF